MSFLGLHNAIERNTGLLIFGILVVASIGGLVQILPTMLEGSLAAPAEKVVPYSALELAGRDLYIRESCSTCHSQQVRPLLAEVRRYGQYSRAGEFAYDRPFLWGSKRTGPDLHRLAGKYTEAWHRLHMTDPRSVVPGSIMPAYPWLAERAANANGDIVARMRALKTLGTPYTDEEIAAAPTALEGKTELDALIVYLQSLGRFASGETEEHAGH
jgi:cytochrome c oxidase cbb3-type subunit 2